MKYGENGKMWITWNVDDQVAKPIFDIVVDSISKQDVHDRLLNNGYQHVEDRNYGKSSMYATDEGSLVEVYMFHRHQLSVSIRSHDSQSVKHLKRFWNSFDNICNMSREEMQE